jgi:hypothetical protein
VPEHGDETAVSSRPLALFFSEMLERRSEFLVLILCLATLSGARPALPMLTRELQNLGKYISQLSLYGFSTDCPRQIIETKVQDERALNENGSQFSVPSIKIWPPSISALLPTQFARFLGLYYIMDAHTTLPRMGGSH